MDAAQWLGDQAHNCLSVCTWVDRSMGNIRSVRTHYTHGGVWILIDDCVILRTNNTTSISDKDVSQRDLHSSEA